jgi:hypothetical protein
MSFALERSNPRLRKLDHFSCLLAFKTNCRLPMFRTACWGCPAYSRSSSTWIVFAVAKHLWGVVSDLSGRHLGALFGLMNSVGLLGAISSQVFLGHFVDWLGTFGYVNRAKWDPAFYIYGGLLLLGAAGWLLVDSERSLIEVQPKSAIGKQTP